MSDQPAQVDLFHDWIFSTLPCPQWPKCALSEHGERGHFEALPGYDTTESIPYYGWNDDGAAWYGSWR